MAAQDDAELFDLCAADGSLLGRRKARSLVHRDGDWHRSLHVWVVLTGRAGQNGVAGGAPLPQILFQRRSAAKDTWPRALDVAVAGHLRAGETFEDALREAEEEIGLSLGLGDVVRLGRRRRADAHAPGIQDNELQEIFAAFTDRPLRAFRPSPEEVEALIALPLDASVRLLGGQGGATARAAGLSMAVGAEPQVVDVGEADLIPAPDGYYAVALKSIAARLKGESPEPWMLG